MDEVLNTAPCGFLSFGDDGTVILINQTLLDTLGYAREAVVGRHVEALLTVGSRIFYQTHWFPLLRLHGRAEEIFLMLRSAGGEDVGVLVNAVRREHSDGVAYDCILMRVRERQKYEDELLRARRVADRARAEVEAHSQDLRQANEQLEAQALELELQQQQLQEQAAELEKASEELRVANEDLLERTEEAERLRAVADEANKAKSTFLAVMSHELRTPLNAIAGYVEILEMGLHGPITPDQREDLGRIARSQRHLLRLINDVLNLARVEAGRVDYAIEQVAVREIVACVLPLIEPQARGKGLTITLEIDPRLLVRADREKAEQVLLNLLGNAVKFTPEGGRIRVEALGAADAEGRVVVHVADTGIGIPPGKLASVFEPFVQVNASRDGTSEGSGLGLAISRDLARGMGGELTATSTVAMGSTFAFALPRAQAAAPGAGDE